MKKKFLIIELTLIVLIHCEMRPKVSVLTIAEGQGFIIHLETDQSFGQIKNCWYQIKDEDKELINLVTDESHQLETGEIIRKYSKSVCGIRVNHLTITSTGIWRLIVENLRNQIVSDTIDINVVVKVMALDIITTNISLPIGNQKISCTEQQMQRFCRIHQTDHNHNHSKSIDSCSIQSMVRHKTTFQCDTFMWGSMIPNHEIIHVNIKQPIIAQSNVEDQNDSIIMKCQFTERVTSCSAELPNKLTQVHIQNGLNTNRYSALNTSTENGLCILEIKKPLDNKEYGIWRIYNDNRNSGCIIYVPAKNINKNELIENAINEIPKIDKLLVKNSTTSLSSLLILCEAPFVLNKCYLRDPQNRIYFLEMHNFNRDRTLGRCVFKIPKLITGEWICGLSGTDYPNEIIQKFNMIVVERNGEIITKNTIQRNAGEMVEMLCQSALMEPIVYCAFVDPKGTVYLASNNFNTKDKRVKYIGNGLEQGQCGLQIEQLRNEEFGEWSCSYMVSTTEFTIKITINRQLEELNTAELIGLGVGGAGIIIFLLISGLFIYRWYNNSRKSNNQVTNSINDEQLNDDVDKEFNQETVHKNTATMPTESRCEVEIENTDRTISSSSAL